MEVLPEDSETPGDRTHTHTLLKDTFAAAAQVKDKWKQLSCQQLINETHICINLHWHRLHQERVYTRKPEPL